MSAHGEDVVEPAQSSTWERVAETSIAIINVLAVFAGIVIVADFDIPGRAAMAVFLFMFGPGSGLVRLLGQFDIAVRWILMVSLSVACSILTAQLLLSLGALDSLWGPVILTLVTATGVLPRARRS